MPRYRATKLGETLISLHGHFHLRVISYYLLAANMSQRGKANFPRFTRSTLAWCYYWLSLNVWPFFSPVHQEKKIKEERVLLDIIAARSRRNQLVRGQAGLLFFFSWYFFYLVCERRRIDQGRPASYPLCYYSYYILWVDATTTTLPNRFLSWEK